MMKETLVQAIQKALTAENITDIVIQVSIPIDQKHGDYTSNVAMVAAKKIGKNPFEVAEGLKGTLSEMAVEGIRKIEVVKPGFLNFWLDQEFIIAQLNNSCHPELVSGSHLLDEMPKQVRHDNEKKQKVMVEFTDPNPFKEFHIGHLYSNIVGESLSRLLETEGNEVWRVTYQGDVGLHVAKSLWGMMELFTIEGSPFMDMNGLEKVDINRRVKFMGEAYALGSTKYTEDPVIKEEINAINKKVYAKDSSILEIYEKGRAWTLEYFDTIYARLGSVFKKNYFESVAGPIGLALVKEHITDGIFKESEGAIIFEGEKHGLHNRVFVNSLGLPTYEAKDMALPGIKAKDYAYDQSIIITADEQSAYFKVVLKVLSLMYPELAAKTKHIAHGMVDIKDADGKRMKMSSRTGNVLTGEWLLDTAKEKIQKAYPDMDADTAEKVAIGSVKYALLKSSIGKNIEFSFDESISFEGNSGPYLQYTYVRTQSILRKSGCHPELVSGSQTTEMPKQVRHDKSVLNQEELTLLRTLFQFDEVVAQAADDLAPSHVATYLFDLAQKFNNFYQKHKILESDQKIFRIGLTEVVGETIKKGLNLLGIPVPEKM
ncbi:MAG: arginine--tRNA ligase [Candidatus Levybacteria bacterium]|nr:arginine--tRNA ligase [Candidatus Levybacteria bacterium]